MNTANLQLKGLYLVVSMNEMLIAKGVASREDIVQSLKKMAEQTAISDYNVEYMSPANRDAVAFPSRLLQLAKADHRRLGAVVGSS
jgi:hypothetical protein